MYDSVSRRQFLQAALAAGVTAPSILTGTAQSLRGEPAPRSKEKLNLGVIGVAAQGAYNLHNVSSENIVALCDIDATRLAGAAKLHPQAKTYDDYRRVLEHKDLDGLVVATPDHMHAFPVVQALRQGLAVYCEKPLAHSVWEIRQIRELAREKKAVTQMGTQIHAGDNYRRVVEMVQAGVIGPVRRVHVWQANYIKPGKRVTSGVVPPGISYDLWIGPAPYRPFHPSHFHFDWRFWWDFGGGTLADIGCHYMDLPYWALDLHAPTTVHACRSEKGHDGDNDVPTFMQVEYQFPARGDKPPVHMSWYQGGWVPEGAEQYGEKKKSAVLFEGDQGRLLADYGSRKVFLQSGKEAEMVPQSIPNSIGHHKEWIDAVKNKGTTTCNFEYSGQLAETVLLGNVSHRIGNKLIEWDSTHLKATNAPEADQYIRREYRKGWVL